MYWRSIIDFGLVVLIWMTQLVVYPSFTYFSESDLFSWHSRYTTAISLIVMPLMLIQVGVHGWMLLHQFTWIGLVMAILIGMAWVNTFFFAVPLHNQIAAQEDVIGAAHSLVKVNWFRTVVWTLVFWGV